MYIRIRCDNGFEECNYCAHCESPVCLDCDEADKFEEGDPFDKAGLPAHEQLEVA